MGNFPPGENPGYLEENKELSIELLAELMGKSGISKKNQKKILQDFSNASQGQKTWLKDNLERIINCEDQSTKDIRIKSFAPDWKNRKLVY